MFSEEEIARICALVVATATGIDPMARRDERRGDDALQYARTLWIQLVVVECGVAKSSAERFCKRSRRAIEYYLAEIEEWRSTDPKFDASLDRWGDSARSLLANIFDLNLAKPSLRERQITRTRLVQRAA